MRSLAVRVLQLVALYVPGATSVRVRLHRMRGVTIGRGVFIGTDVILETSRPELIQIEDEVTLSVRTTVVAHFRGRAPAERAGSDRFSVIFRSRAFVGPGSIILEGVTIGEGSVVAAGSVVNSSVPPMTMVQGNPARPVARCGVPLLEETPMGEFLRHLRPLPRSSA